MHPSLHTPPSTLYTLHFTLSTLDFTLHSTLYTLHTTLYTLHFTLHTLHFTHFTTRYTRRSSLYTPYLTLYTLHSSPTARHQHPSATFTLRAPLLPSSYLKEPHSTLPAQATHFLPSNLTMCAASHTLPPQTSASQQPPNRASPQRARPSHALVPPTFPPSYTPPRNSNPSPLFYASIPSLFPLLFPSFAIVLLCFDSIFASLYPPFHSPQMHVGGRTRGESNPTVTQLPPGTSASKSWPPWLGGEVPQNGSFGDYHPQTPYSHFVRNEQLRHAWQLAFVISGTRASIGERNAIPAIVPCEDLWNLSESFWIYEIVEFVQDSFGTLGSLRDAAHVVPNKHRFSVQKMLWSSPWAVTYGHPTIIWEPGIP